MDVATTESGSATSMTCSEMFAVKPKESWLVFYRKGMTSCTCRILSVTRFAKKKKVLACINRSIFPKW